MMPHPHYSVYLMFGSLWQMRSLYLWDIAPSSAVPGGDDGIILRILLKDHQLLQSAAKKGQQTPSRPLDNSLAEQCFISRREFIEYLPCQQMFPNYPKVASTGVWSEGRSQVRGSTSISTFWHCWARLVVAQIWSIRSPKFRRNEA